MPRAPAPKAARAKCAGCGAALGPRHKFCPSCGAPVVAGAPAPPPAAHRAMPSLQIGSQSADALEEQRKIVTVLFADLSGSTPLAERLDPEELRGILASYFRHLSREIQRFGGTVDKYIGDAVMAVFGAPISHDDDPERAVGAALAMITAIGEENERLERTHGVRLALRIGINTGEVVAGLLAGDVQGAYTVVGDTVNTAQRFESVAAPNTILVGESTYRLARHGYSFETLAPVTLKGKAEPAAAFRVIGVERSAATGDGDSIVGRDAELGRLQAALREAAERGRAIHLSGEAGIGKTRLLNELLARADGTAPPLQARCVSYESATPYALIADLIRQAFGMHHGDEEATARAAVARGLDPLKLPAEEAATTLFLEVLGYGARSSLDPEKKRMLLVSVLRLLLRHESRTGTAVVAAEDVHWMDPASAAVLGAILADITSLRCLFITTSREGSSCVWEAERMAIEPLDDSAAGELLDRLAVTLDPAVRALVLQRTGGNPFFIEEVARTLATNASAKVPVTVQDVLEARVDRLDPAARRVAQRASVIGRQFWVRVLGRIASTESLESAIATLESDALIAPLAAAPERSYVFRHALVQEAAYQMQLLAQRRRLHEAVGDAVVELFTERVDEFVDLLAYHYARSDADGKARRYLLQAGRRAQRLYAKDEALAYYQGALERSADDAETRTAAHEGIGDVQRVAGAYADATTSYEQAIGDLPRDDVVTRARLRRKIGAVRQLQGATDAALEAFALALDELPREAQRERAAVLVEIGLVRWQQGRFEDAVSSLTEAIARAEEAAADDVRADAHRQLGLVHNWQGDGEGALRYAREALALYERAGDVLGQANVLNNIGIAERKAGRYDAALAAQTKALEIRERVGEPWGIGLSSNNLAELHRRLGQLDRAEAGYRRALALFEAIGYSAGIGGACNGLAATMLEQGRSAEAHPYLERAQAELERMGNRTYLVHTERHWALAHLADDRDAALRWAERAVATAETLGASDAEGISLQVLGLVRQARGETADAMAALERSADCLRRTTEHQELARTLVILGRLYARLPAEDPRRGSSPALLEEARTIFAALGAALDLRQLEGAAAVQERAPA